MTQTPPQIKLSFSVDAIILLLEGLGQLPLSRSKSLYDAIERAASQQLEEIKKAASEQPEAEA